MATDNNIPELAGYQERVVRDAAEAMAAGRDVLVEAPTGSGKTAMLARAAAAIATKARPALVLTHRQVIFNQMVTQDAAAASSGIRLGEVERWAGVRPSRIAPDELGGMDLMQGPVVIGMVETVANRLKAEPDLLARFGAVVIDEAHHASEASDARADIGAEKGSYAAIIDAAPNARLIGFTATSFRGDGDTLHPRLEAGRRLVVGTEEAREAGRIVAARTIQTRARLSCGRTPGEVAEEVASGRETRALTVAIAAGRDEAFMNRAVEDWDRLVDRKKTIVFVDSTRDVDETVARFAKMYGDGVAVGLHGRQNERRNADALLAYGEGSAGVLVACKKIDEGFDVPRTDAVMVLNASLSRAQQNQYAGRALRAFTDENGVAKREGLFLDYGATTALHGPVEAQHDLQNIDALANSRSLIAESRTVARGAPAQHGPWSVMAGKRTSFFIRETAPNDFEVWRLDHEAHKSDNRRPGKASGGMARLERMKRDASVGGGSAARFSGRDVARLIAGQARAEAAHYAANGGFGPDHKANGDALIAKWSSNLDTIVGASSMTGAAVAPASAGPRNAARAAHERRAAYIVANLDGESARGRDSAAVLGALSHPESSHRAVMIEGVRLGGVALAHVGKTSGAAEAARVGEAVMAADLKSLDIRSLMLEAEQMRIALSSIAAETGHPLLRKVGDDIMGPVAARVRAVRAEERAAAR